MSDFNRIHNEYLDPDRAGLFDEGPEICPEMWQLLAEELEIELPDGPSKWGESDLESFEERAARSLYRNTTAGLPLRVDLCKVTVSAYCEGSDAELESITLHWPFTAEDFDKAIQYLEKVSDDEWNATHGCERCVEHWQATQGLAEGELGLEVGNAPVWDECPECNGEGIVI